MITIGNDECLELIEEIKFMCNENVCATCNLYINKGCLLDSCPADWDITIIKESLGK